MTSVALVFHGPTSYPATKNFRNALCNFAGGQPSPNFGSAIFTEVYLLLSSEGGSVEDAFSLYNLMRMLPAKIITVNMGQIASAGNIPFLAGDERWACENSYFHFHNLSFFYDKPQSLHRIQMQDHVQIVDKERDLYLSIFKERTKLSDAQFKSLKFLEEPLIKDAGFALDAGIIQKIGMPSIPSGTPILNIDY